MTPWIAERYHPNRQELACCLAAAVTEDELLLDGINMVAVER